MLLIFGLNIEFGLYIPFIYKGTTDDIIIVNIWCKIQIIALASIFFSFFTPSK